MIRLHSFLTLAGRAASYFTAFFDIPARDNTPFTVTCRTFNLVGSRRRRAGQLLDSITPGTAAIWRMSGTTLGLRAFNLLSNALDAFLVALRVDNTPPIGQRQASAPGDYSVFLNRFTAAPIATAVITTRSGPTTAISPGAAAMKIPTVPPASNAASDSPWVSRAAQ